MKHQHLEGNVGRVTLKRFDTFTCMAVREQYGANEINLYLDDVTNEGTTEVMIDTLQTLTVESIDFDNREEDVTKLTIKHDNGNITFIYLDCPFDTLLAAAAAEQMAIRATQTDGNLP